MSTVAENYLLKWVETDTIYRIRCSDCECFGEEFFNKQQAADLSAQAGWVVLGDNVRPVCNRCAAYYPAESIKK